MLVRIDKNTGEITNDYMETDEFIPAHKRDQWRIVIEEPPEIDAMTHELVEMAPILTDTHLERQWAVVLKDVGADDYRDAIQALIDETARSRNYADGVSLASYVSSAVTQWAAEADAFIFWRDAVWVYAYAEMAKVQAALRDKPTVPALLAELPTIAWPE